MAKLIYVANVSLDGYIEDAHGSFDWTEPTDEVFAFITDLLVPGARRSRQARIPQRLPRPVGAVGGTPVRHGVVYLRYCSQS